MAYKVVLPAFEGPVDLLLHLIDKAEVNIWDIPIALITEQYMEYLLAMEKLDLEITSEFLVMAATLLSIKAKMLLPKPPKLQETEAAEEIDPREELVQRLLDYKKFKEVASFLKEKENQQGQMYTRPVDEEAYWQAANAQNPLEGLVLGDLISAFRQLLERVEEEVVAEVPRDEVTVRDKMREIARKLALRPEGLSFHRLFPARTHRLEIVITFIALLELIRMKRVIIHQSGLFEDILIFAPGEEVNHD